MLELVIFHILILVDDTSPVSYGDSLSGWWVLFNSLNPFGYKNIPQLAEIQSRLAYVSSVKQLEDVQNLDGCFYVQPEVQKFGTLEFDKFRDIFQAGYETGKSLVESWRNNGSLTTLFNLVEETPTVSGFSLRRRASI